MYITNRSAAAHTMACGCVIKVKPSSQAIFLEEGFKLAALSPLDKFNIALNTTEAFHRLTVKKSWEAQSYVLNNFLRA